MSRMEITTQDLFLRLGPTWRSRSVRADAVFRKLRTHEADADAEKVAALPVRAKKTRKVSTQETPK